MGIYYGYTSSWGYNNAYSLRMAGLLTTLTDKQIGGLGRDVYLGADPPYDKVGHSRPNQRRFIVAYQDTRNGNSCKTVEVGLCLA